MGQNTNIPVSFSSWILNQSEWPSSHLARWTVRRSKFQGSVRNSACLERALVFSLPLHPASAVESIVLVRSEGHRVSHAIHGPRELFLRPLLLTLGRS